MSWKDEKTTMQKITRSTKECAFLAVFVALLIAVQFALSAIAGIELVSVLFISYVFAMGITRGLFVAVAFSLLRTLLFGFFPSVVILYRVYYVVVAVALGLLGKCLKKKNTAIKTVSVTLTSCMATAGFTLLDDIITPWFYGYTVEATKAYFLASLPVIIPHVICVAISVGVLFIPLYTAFQWLLKRL